MDQDFKIMKTSYLKIVLTITLSFYLTINYAQQRNNANYYQYKNECLENKLNGDFIIKGWGNGSTKSEAINQAKINVLNDIMINGIQKGCKILPLIVELNANKKYEDYLYNFFSKEDIDNFIEIEKSPKDLKKSRKKTTYGVKFKVKRQLLKQKLINDNIIKK